VYETYAGEIVTIIDARAGSCADPAHERGNMVPSDQRTERSPSP